MSVWTVTRTACAMVEVLVPAMTRGKLVLVSRVMMGSIARM